MAEKNLKWPIYCDFSHFPSIISPCGCGAIAYFSCILLKFVMHVANNQFSDMFNDGWTKIQNRGHNKFKKISCILLKFVMLVANNQFSAKFNYGDGLLLSMHNAFVFTNVTIYCWVFFQSGHWSAIFQHGHQISCLHFNSASVAVGCLYVQMPWFCQYLKLLPDGHLKC